MLDGFAMKPPARADPETTELAPSERSVDVRRTQLHRGMQLEEVSELGDGHDVTAPRGSYLVVYCQLRSSF